MIPIMIWISKIILIPFFFQIFKGLSDWIRSVVYSTTITKENDGTTLINLHGDNWLRNSLPPNSWIPVLMYLGGYFIIYLILTIVILPLFLGTMKINFLTDWIVFPILSFIFVAILNRIFEKFAMKDPEYRAFRDGKKKEREAWGIKRRQEKEGMKQ
jgi:hypothetical protein